MNAEVLLDDAGREVLLTGNEAVARGALEAGVNYAASYPGSPTAEILEALAHAQKLYPDRLYTEWSVNEKVAMEGAAAASFAGLRSLTIMKCDGLNVAFDFLTSLGLSGTRGGMVIAVGDDPSAHSSAKEEDSRYLGRLAHLAIWEPADSQQAKEMVKAAFDLSEQMGQPVMLRLTTRVCHAATNATLGPLPKGPAPQAIIAPTDKFITWIEGHKAQEERLLGAVQVANRSNFNRYLGPDQPEILVVACGPSFHYAHEAVEELRAKAEDWGLGSLNGIGILQLATAWPLPEELLLGYLKSARQVIVLEEIEPFVEDYLLGLVARNSSTLGQTVVYGKHSGHVASSNGIGLGELNPELVYRAIAKAIAPGALAPVASTATPSSKPSEAGEQPSFPGRDLAFCAGCPHRASFWALRSALELDGRRGIILGDIGCYSLAKGRTGFNAFQTMHAMGSGAGIASGLGQLWRFGFSQPVVAVVGDSTFYHAVVPALINGRYTQSNFLCIILDNQTTAMTGHQPHPGTGGGAAGDPLPPVPMEQIISGLGLPFTILDPFDIPKATAGIYAALQQPGVQILILRQTCALIATKREIRPEVYVDPDLCRGYNCSCFNFCSRVFACPGNIWDDQRGVASIDQSVCNRCGVCISLCPAGAIKTRTEEDVSHEQLAS